MGTPTLIASSPDHRYGGQAGTRSGCRGDRCIRGELLRGGDGPGPGLLPRDHSVRSRLRSSHQKTHSGFSSGEGNSSLVLLRPAAKEKGLAVLMDSRRSPPSALCLAALKAFQVRSKRSLFALLRFSLQVCDEGARDIFSLFFSGCSRFRFRRVSDRFWFWWESSSRRP